MREILFRGKRMSDGEWLYGSLLQVNRKGATECCIHSDRYSHLIDHATVGQFTGLTDKNGKRIFEGDIVKNDKYFMLVEWYDFLASFALAFSANGSYHETMSNSNIYYEVIGNIHDNPELMEVET